ncbi:hypothetical protein ACE1CD_15435 [Aerosakkonema sp. BLCC-F183]|uniref:hypothetical protein n=1 Tax=Aerosakkonema sp. BLCC-F183 TaxID=3342834 RepID=UPI0035B7EBA0
MEIKRYRFNRKVGKIYLESLSGLIEIGSEMKVIILWAGDVVFGKPFPHLPAQNWVQLTFLDNQGNWCYALLNSGNTNALYPWTEYRKKIEQSHQLLEIVTTIGFDSSESYYGWFDYKFSGVLGKPGLGDRMRQLIRDTKQFSLVDLDINLPI